MRTLIALSALLAAALVAVIFPEMKKLLLLVPFALLAFLVTGCGTMTKALRNLPDGHFENLELSETGKFTNTTGKFTVLDKDADVIRARGLDLRHANPWFPNISLKSDVAVLDVSPTARRRANPAPIELPGVPPSPPARPPQPASQPAAR